MMTLCATRRMPKSLCPYVVMPTARSSAPFVFYKNPYGGHPILRRCPRDAAQAILDFLATCTDWNGTWANPRLSLLPRDKYTPDGWAPASLRLAIETRLGTPEQGVTFNNIDTGESETGLDWPLPTEHFAWALDFTLSQPPAKRRWPDPVSLHAFAEFNLRDPRTGHVLHVGDRVIWEGRMFRSEMSPSFSAGNTSAFFDLYLPFETAGDELVEYVRAIRPYLPIRLAKGGFRLATPRATKRASVSEPEFSIRRVPASLFTAI